MKRFSLGPRFGPRHTHGLSGLRGATGIRTPDLLHAMQTRYQLRYSPSGARSRDHRVANVDSLPNVGACVVPNVAVAPGLVPQR